MIPLIQLIFHLSFHKIHKNLSLSLGFASILCSAAPGVGDVGDYVLGLFEHPVVAPGDGVVASARKVRRLYQFS